MRPATQLRRNITNRKIAGVAAGLSDFLGIDVTLIRVLFILSTLFTGGAGALIYLVCWLLIPQATSAFSPARPPQRRGLSWVLVIVALVVGALIAINDNRAVFITFVVVVIVLSLWRKVRGRSSWKTHKEFQKARLAWQRRLDEQANQAAHPTYLGGNPFQIDSFYPQSPPDQESDNPNSGFQIQ